MAGSGWRDESGAKIKQNQLYVIRSQPSTRNYLFQFSVKILDPVFRTFFALRKAGRKLQKDSHSKSSKVSEVWSVCISFILNILVWFRFFLSCFQIQTTAKKTNLICQGVLLFLSKVQKSIPLSRYTRVILSLSLFPNMGGAELFSTEWMSWQCIKLLIAFDPMSKTVQNFEPN